MKNEQAHPKQPEHSNSEPEIDTVGIVDVPTIYIRKRVMKGRVLEVLTENTVGHKIVTVSAKQGQQDLISCRTLENSGLGSKQKSMFCKTVSQTHSAESLGSKRPWLRDTGISCYISRHGFMTLLSDFSTWDISYSWRNSLKQLGVYQRRVFSMPEDKLQASDFAHTHREV